MFKVKVIAGIIRQNGKKFPVGSEIELNHNDFVKLRRQVEVIISETPKAVAIDEIDEEILEVKPRRKKKDE